MGESDTAPETVGAPSWLDRGLGLLTVVRPGEAASALLLALNVLLLLCAYYVLKPVREALILSGGGGAEIKTYAALGQIVLLSLVVPGYSWLVARFARVKLIRTVTFVFVGCLVLFYFGARAELPGLSVAFFLWVGIFNLMVIAQFWAFASDVYSREQGERLFPVVALGASLGAVAGSHLTSLLVGTFVGIPELMLVSAALLFLALLLTLVSERAAVRVGCSDDSKESARSDSKAEKGLRAATSAFRLVIASPYLRWLAALMLLSNLVNTTGEFILSSFVEEEAKRHVQGAVAIKEWIGHFYSEFFLWVNVAGVVIQLFVAPRFIRHLGVRVTLLVLPAVALFGYLAVAVLPALLTARWAKTSENAIDYSLNNTVRNALFLPLAKQEKYRAKQVVDTIFVRAGDALTAGLVFVGLHWLDASMSFFAIVNVVLVGLWLAVALQLGKAYAVRTREQAAET